jgi:serine/threonine protein kinase
MIERMKAFGKSLSLSDIKSLMIQILKAVDYMHRNYTLHRDLKLSNILLNKKGELKLADYGLARYYGKLMHNIINKFLQHKKFKI